MPTPAFEHLPRPGNASRPTRGSARPPVEHVGPHGEPSGVFDIRLAALLPSCRCRAHASGAFLSREYECPWCQVWRDPVCLSPHLSPCCPSSPQAPQPLGRDRVCVPTSSRGGKGRSIPRVTAHGRGGLSPRVAVPPPVAPGCAARPWSGRATHTAADRLSQRGGFRRHRAVSRRRSHCWPSWRAGSVKGMAS